MSARLHGIDPRASAIRQHAALSATHWSRPAHTSPTLRPSSQPLDYAVRQEMESRFGRDLSVVRVHTDQRAAKSARAVGAAAYTVGNHMVFGQGRYSPRSTAGRELIAHELTHVIQQDGCPASGPLEIGPAADELELQAAAQAARAADSVETAAGTAGTYVPPSGRRPTRGRVLQRSLLGGLAGGLTGAAGGALIGGLLGGPVGAVVGGLAGLVGGALIGDVTTTRKRSLTTTEIAYAKDVFKDSIDYSEITITRDSMLSTGAPKTIGNTIHLRSDWGHFAGDSMQLTQAGMETLIHEMGHVWQYQNGGLAYIPESLWAQFKGFIGSGSRSALYDWREAHRAGLPWEKWNPEQQASAIEDYNVKLRKSKDGTATLFDLSELSTLLRYMSRVWARRGAPHFATPEPKATGSP